MLSANSHIAVVAAGGYKQVDIGGSACKQRGAVCLGTGRSAWQAHPPGVRVRWCGWWPTNGCVSQGACVISGVAHTMLCVILDFMPCAEARTSWGSHRARLRACWPVQDGGTGAGARRRRQLPGIQEGGLWTGRPRAHPLLCWRNYAIERMNGMAPSSCAEEPQKNRAVKACVKVVLSVVSAERAVGICFWGNLEC